MATEAIIQLSGRIPKYFFGTVREEFRDELDSILEYCHEDIEEQQDFLKAILELTLEFSSDAKDEFFDKVISQESLDEFPKFKELYETIIEEDAGHFRLMELLFDSGYKFSTVTFFEEDAEMLIEFDGQKLFEGTLGEFKSVTSGGNIEEDADSDDAKSIISLAEANRDFMMDTEWMEWEKNEHGSTFVKLNMDPESFAMMVGQDYNVTIYMDDITSYTFYHYIESEFDMSKLTFVSYAYADDFRNSAYSTALNYVFYDNEQLEHEENWLRDKGIELFFNGDESIDFLLNG